jgi:hypothetical protein
MVEAPTIEVKIAPSRDHGHLIDGILSLDSRRVGWTASTAAHMTWTNETTSFTSAAHTVGMKLAMVI